MRLLRAVRAHAGAVLLLAATTVLSAGALVVATAAAGDDARRTALVPLAALALLVAAGPATDLARRRRAELTLVRLRGGHGAGLSARVAGESVAVVLTAGVLGLVAGAVAVRLLHTRWDLPELVEVPELVPAVVLLAALAAEAGAAAGVVAREPLQAAVRRGTWSGPGTTARFVALVAGVATVLAAVVAVYAAGTDDPGSLVLAAPVLVGAATAQVVVWAVRGVRPAAARLAGSRSTAVLLGVRRALGEADAARLRSVVAAGVVLAASAGAVVATSGWADESARLRQGGPMRLELPDTTAQATLLLTRRLDPEGRWLMAAAVNDRRDEARFRTAWLDLERFVRVSAGFLGPTPADVDEALDALRAAPAVRPVTGDAVTMTATGPPGSTVTVAYVGDEGFVASVVVPVAGGTAPVGDCVDGCVVLSLVSSEAVEVSALSLGDADVLAGGWVDEDGAAPEDGALALDPGTTARPAAATAPEPLLVAGRPDFGDGAAEVDDVGGSTRTVDQVGTRPALPLVEGAGLLGDLPVALAGAPGTVPAVRSLVLARADTPPEVLDALRDAGAEPPTVLDPARGGLGARERAEDRVRQVALVASAALLVLALGAGRRRRMRDLRHDDTALRRVGVPVRILRRARWVEAVVVGGLALAGTLAGGWLAATVLDAVGLVPTGASRLPLDVPPSFPLLLTVAAGGALLAGASLLPGPRRGRTETTP